MATSLLGFGLMLPAGAALAQTSPATYPMVQPPPSPLASSPAAAGQQSARPVTVTVTRTGLNAPQIPDIEVKQDIQQRGVRQPYDSFDTKTFFGVPSMEVLTRLETEAELFRRMEQEGMRNGERVIFPEDKPLAREPYPGRHWAPKTMIADAPYVAHERLLFEQENFERGLWNFGILTPPLEIALFSWDTVMLPYHLATRPCQQYDTSAGKCLPGDPSPFRISPFEWSLSGAVAEGAAVTGAFFIFP